MQGVLCDKAHTRDPILTPARLHVVVQLRQVDEVVVSCSHKNGHCGKGIANGLTVSLQSDGPAPCRYNMVSNIPSNLAGEKEINARIRIFRVGWISSTPGQTLVGLQRSPII